jgi:hypothetical protein
MTDDNRIRSWLELTAAVRKLSPDARERFAELYRMNNKYGSALSNIASRHFMSVHLSLQEEVDMMRKIALESLSYSDDDADIDGDF